MKNISVAEEPLNLFFNLSSAFYPLDMVEKYTKKYGDFYKLKVPNNPPFIMISNPQAIKEIFIAPEDTFRSAETNKVFSFLLGDNSILLLDGKAHQNRRRLLMPPFHGESLQQCGDRIISITNKVCDRLEVNQSFVVRPCLQEITLRVILSVVFGIDSGKRYEQLRELLVELLETFSSPLKSMLIIFPSLQKDWGKFSPWGRFLRLKSKIKQLIYQEIKERRALLAKGELHQDIQ